MAMLDEQFVTFAGGKLRVLAGDRSGATAVEYGIIAAGIAVTIIAALNIVGSEVSTLFNTISVTVNDAVSN